MFYFVTHPPLLLALIACGDDVTQTTEESEDIESIEQAATVPCQPDPGYDSCEETSIFQSDHWQSTLPDPDWRTISPTKDPDLDYVVEIDAHELNGGVIPTATGQGNYSSWTHFFQTIGDLIGVHVDLNRVGVIVDGATLKVDTNGQPVVGSTGHFIYDALSDEDGQIYIDNQNVTGQIVPHGSGHTDHVIQSGSNTTSLSGSTSTSSDPSTASPPIQLSDTTTLAAGNWTADFTLSISEVEPLVWHNAEVTNISWGPAPPCTWVFDSSLFTIQRHCFEADTAFVGLHLPNSAYEDIKAADAEATTTGLKVTTWGPGPYLSSCARAQVLFDSGAGDGDNADLELNYPQNCAY